MGTRVIQNSFAGGELTPAVFGRHDLEAYYKGAAKIENFTVLKTGGLKKRPGIQPGNLFSSGVSHDNAGADAAVVPYRFNRSEGGVLVATQSPAEGSALKTTVTYYKKQTGGTYKKTAAADLPEYIYPPSIMCEQIGDTVLLFGLSAEAGTPAAVARVMVNHVAETLTAGGYAVTQPPAGPHSVSWAAFGDKMIVSDESSKARTLYYAVYTATGGVRSAPSGCIINNTNAEWPAGHSIKITATVRAVAGVYPDEIIFAKRSGALYGELARLPNSDYTTDMGGATPYRTYVFTDENHLAGMPVYKQTPLFGAGSTVAAACATLFQQRLAFAGLPGEPFSILFSRIGDFRGYHSNRPVADDDPFRVTLATDSPAAIRHAVSYRESMLLFCDTGVWRVSGSSTEGFTPRTCQVFQLNDIGCSPRVKPVKTTDGVVFVAADNRTVYELRYDLTRDAITPAERSILSDHLTEGRSITSMTHQRFPASVIWITLDNGRFLSFSYQPEHELYAWAQHAAMAGSGVGAPVRACATGTVTGPDSDVALLCADAAWASQFNPAPNGSCYRLNRLSPSSASDDATPVRAELTTLRPELPDRNVQGIPKNITDCLVRVRGTRRLSVRSFAGGEDTAKLLSADGPDPQHPEQGAEPDYTGNVKIMPRGCVNDDGQMTLVSDSGPCEIQCVVWKVEM